MSFTKPPRKSLRSGSGGQFLLLSVAVFLAALAGVARSEPVRKDNVTVELLSGVESLQPGQPFEVALKMDLDPGWHTYWINPGSPGEAATISWELPDGFEAGPLRFPYPEQHVAFSTVFFGYEKEVVYLTTITPPADVKPGQQVTLNANVKWLACEDICVQGEADLSVSVKVADSAVPASGPVAAVLAQAKERMPREVEGVSLSSRVEGESVIYTVGAGDLPLPENLNELYLYPETLEVVNADVPQEISVEGGELIVKAAKLDYAPQPLPKSFRAVLVSESGFGDPVNGKAIQLSSDAGHSGNEGPSIEAFRSPLGNGLMGLLVMGFLGGVILNVMPCVFPVISLKIMSFVSIANEDRKKILTHGLVFTLGVMVFFWVISLVMILIPILAGGGGGEGWGAWLQIPGVVMALAAVMVLLALWLFGVFDIGLALTGVGGKLTASSGLGGSFWSGALAVVLATPCTGPFMAPALGFVLVMKDPAVTFSLFTALGLGMAFPYLLLSAFPRLLKFLPRPGAWMESFKQIMGFPMLATAVWLLWVLEGQVGDMGMMVFGLALVVLAMAGWALGRFLGPGASQRSRIGGGIAVAIFLAAAIGMSWKAAQLEQKEDSLVENFAEVIQQHRMEGKNVFVDFTARWCLTCRVNKQVMHSEDIQKAFREHNVVFLEVDWTNKNEETLAYMQKYGRSGVPFYPLFPADVNKEPLILPEILTKPIVLKKLQELSAMENGGEPHLTQSGSGS